MKDDKRLIEDYLPIQAISAEASREKSVRKGHISTLHLWWARRPLVACRAAVYGALVPASRFAWSKGAKKSAESSDDGLGRAEAERFVEALCKYPGSPAVIREAEQHILEAHAERLSDELGKKITVEDIIEGRAPRPRVLDMFAGGGAIPLEALRLGCEAYALDLNPVAHIIELCTLVYPQKYGKPDNSVRGMTGPKNDKGETTWGGLSEEVRYWGNWVLGKVRAEIGDLYPPIPDPNAKPKELVPERNPRLFEESRQKKLKAPGEYLTPVAYLWTRTVRCKNRSCNAEIPLVRQTWLRKKGDRYIALKMIAPKGDKCVRFKVVQAPSEAEIGFDPASFSKSGNAICPFCGTVADSEYVKAEACGGRLHHQVMATVCEQSKSGKRYIDPDADVSQSPSRSDLAARTDEIAQKLNVTILQELLEANPRSFDVQHFGFTKWQDVFTPRQLVAMITFAGMIKRAHVEMTQADQDADRAKGLALCLSMALGRLADYCTSFCTWQPEFIKNTFNSPGLRAI